MSDEYKTKESSGTEDITENGQYKSIEKLLQTIEASEKNYDVEKIKRAYQNANSLHE